MSPLQSTMYIRALVLTMKLYKIHRYNQERLADEFKYMIKESQHIANTIRTNTTALTGSDLEPIAAYKNCILMMMSDGHKLCEDGQNLTRQLYQEAKNLTDKVLHNEQGNVFCKAYDKAMKDYYKISCATGLNNAKLYWFDWASEGYQASRDFNRGQMRILLQSICEDYHLRSQHFQFYCSLCEHSHFGDEEEHARRRSDLAWLEIQEKRCLNQGTTGAYSIKRQVESCYEKGVLEAMARVELEQALREQKVYEWIQKAQAIDALHTLQDESDQSADTILSQGKRADLIAFKNRNMSEEENVIRPRLYSAQELSSLGQGIHTEKHVEVDSEESTGHECIAMGLESVVHIDSSAAIHSTEVASGLALKQPTEDFISPLQELEKRISRLEIQLAIEKVDNKRLQEETIENRENDSIPYSLLSQCDENSESSQVSEKYMWESLLAHDKQGEENTGDIGDKEDHQNSHDSEGYKSLVYQSYVTAPAHMSLEERKAARDAEIRDAIIMMLDTWISQIQSEKEKIKAGRSTIETYEFVTKIQRALGCTIIERIAPLGTNTATVNQPQFTTSEVHTTSYHQDDVSPIQQGQWEEYKSYLPLIREFESKLANITMDEREFQRHCWDKDKTIWSGCGYSAKASSDRRLMQALLVAICRKFNKTSDDFAWYCSWTTDYNDKGNHEANLKRDEDLAMLRIFEEIGLLKG